MKVLLDTQAWLWLQDRVGRFSYSTLEILQDPDTDRILSMASAWEVSIKFALGKLRLPEAPDRYLPDRLALSMTRILPIELRHALHVAQLPPYHRDPFDRMLVAQALIERMPLLTADKRFSAYGVEVLSI
ncbi:MAG TPA: type II toxin-antitoxin system VapC family toxin [Myxococcales bacterium]|nr:type II toxin-antitoxin system VapC family toxin [Myxococcales bacterium]